MSVGAWYVGLSLSLSLSLSKWRRIGDAAAPTFGGERGAADLILVFKSGMECDGRTDGRTDGWTDGQTPSYSRPRPLASEVLTAAAVNIVAGMRRPGFSLAFAYLPFFSRSEPLALSPAPPLCLKA